ncbi:hypothetical protein HDU80_009086 [Chytriomyces hyalinus]|nr:hypothetical protein HDU80_009086 [Chytriomyces hyalinus]
MTKTNLLTAYRSELENFQQLNHQLQQRLNFMESQGPAQSEYEETEASDESIPVTTSVRAIQIVKLYFDSLSTILSTKSKITFVASFLCGNVFDWYKKSVLDKDLTFTDYNAFKVFFLDAWGKDTVISEEAALEALANLKQTTSAQAYTNRFTSPAACTQHNEYSKMNECIQTWT